MAEEDPSILDATRIVQRSPPWGMPPVVVHPDTDADLKGRLRSLLLGMHDDPAGKEVLESLGIDRFVVPDASLYDSVREGAAEWESW